MRGAPNPVAALIVTIAAVAVASCSPNRSHAEKMIQAMHQPGEIVRFADYDELTARDGRWACLSFYTKNEFGNVSGEQSAMLQLKPGQSAWTFQGIVPNPHALCLKDVRLLHGG
jgi:hypothetical protein